MASPFDTNPQLDYDLRSAQKAGLTEEDIARYASDRRNYDYDSARKAGLTDTDIIRYNIADVSTAGLGRAFLETAVPAAVIAKPVMGGFGKGFQVGSRAGAAIGTGIGAVAGRGLPPITAAGRAIGYGVGGVFGALVGGAIPALVGAKVAEEVKEATGRGGQYAPSVYPGVIGGETFGFLFGAGLPIRGALSKLSGKTPGTQVSVQGGPFAAPGVKPVDLGSSIFLDAAATNPGMNKAMEKALKWGEETLTSGRQFAYDRPGSALIADLGMSTGAATAGAVSELVDPGNLYLRIPAEILGGLFNIGNIAGSYGSRLFNFVKRGTGQSADERRVGNMLKKFFDDLEKTEGPGGEKYKVELQPIIDRLRKNIGDDIDLPPMAPSDIGPRMPEGPVLNSAEKAGDDLLKVIFSTVMDLSGPKTGVYKREILLQSQTAYAALGKLMSELGSAASDNPQMMSMLSEFEEGVFKEGLEALLNLHVTKAAQQAVRIGKGEERRTAKEEARRQLRLGPVDEPTGGLIEGIPGAGKVLIETVMESFNQASNWEKKLWHDPHINKKIEVPINNLLQFWNKATDPEQGGSEAAKSLYINYVDLWMKEQTAPYEETLGPLRELRDTLQAQLEKARENLVWSSKALAAKSRARSGDWSLGNTQKRANEAISTIPPELESVKGQITEIEAGVETSLGKILQFRSEMLRQSRVKDATEIGASQAGFYSQLSRAAMDDIEKAQLSGEDAASRDAIMTAIAGTRAKHDVFSRAFGGDLLAKTTTGEPRITPDVIAQRVITRSGLTGAKNLRQLEEALDFVIERAPPVGQLIQTEDAGEIFLMGKAELEALKNYDYRGATEVIMREILLKDVQNAVTKEVDPGKMARALREFAPIFEIPGMKLLEKDLLNAQTAKATLDSWRQRIKDASGYSIQKDADVSPLVRTAKRPPDKFFEGDIAGRTYEDLKTMRLFLGETESPMVVMEAILTSNKPQDGLRRVGQIALKNEYRYTKRAELPEGQGLEASPVESFKRLIFDTAIEKARNKDTGIIDFRVIREILQSPMARHQPSVLEFLHKLDPKLISTDEINNFSQIVKYATRVEETLNRLDTTTPNVTLEEILQNNSMFTAALQRGGGAVGFSALFDKIKAMMGFQGSQAAGLVAAGLGSNLASQYWQKLPYGATQRILFEVMKDNDATIAMLESIKTPKDVFTISKRLAPVITAVVGKQVYDEMRESLERESKSPQPGVLPSQSYRDPRLALGFKDSPAPALPPSPPLVTPPGPSAPPLPPMPAAPAAAPAAAPPSPDTRSRYASLFPFDPASEIIRSRQGIASIP